MKIKTWFIAGIIGVAVISGVLEALMAPRKKEETEEMKQEEETASEGGNAPGERHRVNRRPSKTKL
jgi:hypothetical protein